MAVAAGEDDAGRADDGERSSASTDLRRRLLKVAAEEFGDLGYESATVSHIARRCGATSGAVYARWPSKLDLFVATIEEASLRRPLLDFKDSEGTPAEKLTALGAKALGMGMNLALRVQSENRLQPSREEWNQLIEFLVDVLRGPPRDDAAPSA